MKSDKRNYTQAFHRHNAERNSNTATVRYVPR